MGLGKTVQLAAFLAGLHQSGLFKPTLIVCPATVLRQWLRELRLWYPLFRVVILHDSSKSSSRIRQSRRDLVASIAKSPAGVLVTSYEQLRLQRDELLHVPWGYAILDEGHKIRNPDAEVTLVAKQLQTVHRIIMTGSPIQNKLAELWSLFDYVFPGKLGTLPVFTTQFALPIQFGGYANASQVQVTTAYKCAVVLRDLISPYLLRRRKADVNAQLPQKTEQVLFCKLSKEQRDIYRSYLSSKEVEEIVQGDKNALAGIDILRKICNHPDLLERTKYQGTEDYGNPERSGKLTVALKVLAHWHEQGHKALLFTQTQQMLDILEGAVQRADYSYHRMDGSTPIGMRARLVDDFNNKGNVFVFLLTTKVGGLGINLTGANRVMVYDPDWNPSTDMQARERAWRIGQKRQVTVYRLITSGTIEEKVYHRQIYKQFLTNKVLSDPRQKRFFKAKDMADLFTLGDEYAPQTETADMFASLNGEVTAPEDPEAGQIARPQAGHDNAKILRDLFEGTGVLSALDHSKIEGANDPEARAVDYQASRVARQAAEALRLSRALAGTSGASAALRSEDLLARMRSRQQVLTTAAQDDATAAASADPPSVAGPSSSYTIAENISRQLVHHLQQHSGAASSSQIITSFPNIDQQHAVLFKQTLRQVAVLQRGAAGGKQWHLKPEFDQS
eukprot:jgi/Astpho2/1490/fgenesh1_pm.00026_%23_10_t